MIDNFIPFEVIQHQFKTHYLMILNISLNLAL